MLLYTCVSPDRAFYHSTCYILEAYAFSHLCIHSMFQGGDAFLSLNLISAYANKGEKVTQQEESDLHKCERMHHFERLHLSRGSLCARCVEPLPLS